MSCPWLDTCGGCALGALDLAAQHARKATFVSRAFGRDAPLVGSPRATGYRARVKLSTVGGRVGFRAAGSHALVEVGTCAIARAEVQAAIPRLREVDLRGLDSVELRSDGARVVFAAEGRPAKGALAALGDVAINGRAAHGDPTLTLRVAGQSLRASPRAFYQVNLEANERLVAHVREAVHRARAERVLDLYAGIGNFSLPIAADGVPVVAVERDGQSLGDLRASAGELPVRALALPVEKLDPSREVFDVAVLDPPRAGAAGVIERLVRNRPRALIYVTCNPPSAARDLRAATKAGYRLTDLTAFDLFPDTDHVEAVAVLER